MRRPKHSKPLGGTVRKFWKRQSLRHIDPWLNKLNRWQQVTYGCVRVHFRTQLDGGGTSFGQDFIPFLERRQMPRQHRVFEWCAGPGFIGFSLLAHGLAETLCLADINPEAVKACQRTITENGLADRVSIYHSDNLKNIPDTERWDLVVGNPPHFDDRPGDLRGHDDDWRLHRQFFTAVGGFLRPGGVIVLQENNRGSTAETFRPMIEASGLRTVFVVDERPERTARDRFYFIGIMRSGDPAPAWSAAPPA